MYFLNIFQYIYQTETHKSLKLGYSSGQGSLSAICTGKKPGSVSGVCSSPNNEATSNGIVLVFSGFLAKR